MMWCSRWPAWYCLKSCYMRSRGFVIRDSSLFSHITNHNSQMKRLILILVAIGLLIYGFYLAWFAAPTEETMGDIQRIFYYHVPSAWTAFVLFFGNFIASIVYLKKRSPKSDDIALACAE